MLRAVMARKSNREFDWQQCNPGFWARAIPKQGKPAVDRVRFQAASNSGLAAVVLCQDSTSLSMVWTYSFHKSVGRNGVRGAQQAGPTHDVSGIEGSLGLVFGLEQWVMRVGARHGEDTLQ